MSFRGALAVSVLRRELSLMGSYRIEKRGSHFVVFDAEGLAVSGGFTEYAVAMASMERRQRTSQRGYRPCMSCRKPFLSEGWHNRLCPRCKALGD